MSEERADKPVLLIVDDSKVIRRAASKMLGTTYKILEAVDGHDGWKQLQEEASITVVFTDIQMPLMDGIELLSRIRESDDERIANTPVIILTGHGDNEETKQEVFDKGATDFITKPFDSITLLSRAKSYAKMNRKIVELEEKTTIDDMTGLFTANSYVEHGKKAVSFSSRHFLDISTIAFEIVDFQKLFLGHGKSIAQHIIGVVGKKLKDVMRSEDIAARTGVAKYALLLPMTNSSDAIDIASRVRGSINKLVFDTGKEKIRVSLAAGIVPYDRNEEMPFEDFLKKADQTLAKALKQTGEKVVCVKLKEQYGEAVTEEDIKVALDYIASGQYGKVSDRSLQAVADRIKPFLEYVESRLVKQKTGSD